MAAAVICFSGGPVFGQDDIGTLYNKSVQEMSEQKWEEALKIIDQVIKEFGEFAYDDYGAMFGGIYYNKGICELRLRDYENAAESFRKSHEDFPNDKPEGKESAPDGINPYEKTAVFQRALCMQLAQKYQEALDLYKKFEGLKPGPDELQPGAFFINQGICQANLGQLDEAMKSITMVFDNQARYRIQTANLLQGFVHLGGAWSRLAMENPEAAEEAHRFMDKYLPQLRMKPYEMQKFNPLVIKMAQEAGKDKQYGLALRYYSLYAGTMDAIQDLLDRAIAYGGVTAKIQEEIDALQAKIDSGDPVDVNVLRGIAACYEGLGNFHASLVIFRFLEKVYPKSQSRPEILFGSTRAAAAHGDVTATQQYGLEFLEKYKDHELYDRVSNFVIGALFERREYTRCIEIANKVKETVKEGTDARDLLEFVLGASHYSLGEYDTAGPILDAHVRDYPKSQYIANSAYFRASNVMKKEKFAQAGKLFDDYIEAYPLSPLLDIVLYERALCEYIIQEEEFGVALGMIERLEKEFPDSKMLDSGLVLRGDIQKTLEEYEDAERSYVEGKEAGERLGNKPMAAEALSKALDVAVLQEKWDVANGYYDEFFQKFEDTPSGLQVAVVGLQALKQKERTPEGLDRLAKMIVAMSKEDNAEGMERAVNSYVANSAETLGVDETIAKLDNFPGLDEGATALKAWLLVSKVGLLQDQLKGMKKDDPDYGKKTAMVKVAFSALKDYDRSQLGNFILIQVGRYIVNTGNPYEAMPFFEEIGGRENKQFEDFAILEMAKVWARSKEAAMQDKALEAFRKIIDVYQTKELVEDASLGVARLYAARDDWNNVLDFYQRYQQNKSFRTARPEANFMIGRAYEGLGDVTRAQKVYINVFVLYPGHVEWSAQAIVRNANLEYEKGQANNAYEMLRDLERRLGHLRQDDESGWISQGLRRLDELRGELQITPEMEAQREKEALEKTAP